MIGLDIETGKLKFYHQELPHDAWDFDSAVGEFVMLDRNGKQYVVHPNKSGFIFVYNRTNAKLENVWPLVKNINFVKRIDPKTGELIGRRDFQAGKVAEPLCPFIGGGVSWNSGSTRHACRCGRVFGPTASRTRHGWIIGSALISKRESKK